jgi:hypothetical protein
MFSTKQMSSIHRNKRAVTVKLRSAIFTRFSVNAGQVAPALITCGLAVLLAHALLPEIPVLTAIALISLGATIATTKRLDHPRSSRPVLAAHLLCYAAIYLLSVGAVLDGSLCEPPSAGLTVARYLDLCFSAGLMAFIARICVPRLFSPRGSWLG